MRSLSMQHTTDPKEEITAAMGSLENVEVFHNQILVAIYMRPEKTKGGIILTETTRGEDRYQGKVGLILKKGPLAFVSDRQVDFGGVTVEVGDWIGFRASDGWSLTIGTMACRMLQDVDVKLRLSQPDFVF